MSTFKSCIQFRIFLISIRIDCNLRKVFLLREIVLSIYWKKDLILSLIHLGIQNLKINYKMISNKTNSLFFMKII